MQGQGYATYGNSTYGIFIPWSPFKWRLTVKHLLYIKVICIIGIALTHLLFAYSKKNWQICES